MFLDSVYRRQALFSRDGVARFQARRGFMMGRLSLLCFHQRKLLDSRRVDVEHLGIDIFTLDTYELPKHLRIDEGGTFAQNSTLKGTRQIKHKLTLHFTAPIKAAQYRRRFYNKFEVSGSTGTCRIQMPSSPRWYKNNSHPMTEMPGLPRREIRRRSPLSSRDSVLPTDPSDADVAIAVPRERLPHPDKSSQTACLAFRERGLGAVLNRTSVSAAPVTSFTPGWLHGFGA
jgi:hypothetical protein